MDQFEERLLRRFGHKVHVLVDELTSRPFRNVLDKRELLSIRVRWALLQFVEPLIYLSRPTLIENGLGLRQTSKRQGGSVLSFSCSPGRLTVLRHLRGGHIPGHVQDAIWRLAVGLGRPHALSTPNGPKVPLGVLGQ